MHLIELIGGASKVIWLRPHPTAKIGGSILAGSPSSHVETELKFVHVLTVALRAYPFLMEHSYEVEDEETDVLAIMAYTQRMIDSNEKVLATLDKEKKGKGDLRQAIQDLKK